MTTRPGGRLRPPTRVGNQTPRVRTAPAHAFTSGPDAAKLAALAGLILDPWQCAVLDDALGERDDGRWSAGEVSVWVPRQNGKGSLIEARVLYGLFVLREKLILWSAHQYRTAQEGFLRVRDLIRSCAELDAQVKRYWEANGEQGIELKTGERLRFVARSRSAARGFSGDLVILDEAQFLTEAQMAALMPTMSARPNPQIWYLGTPPDDPAAWVYGIKADGEAGRDGLVHYDWGQDLNLADPEVLAKAADPELWYAANPALGQRITREYVEQEFARLKMAFIAERLGVWLPPAAEGHGVITEAEWSKLLLGNDAEPEFTADVVIGVDTSVDRTRSAIVMVGRRSDGLMQISIGAYHPGTQWVVAKLLELRDRHQPIAIALDTKRAAGSLLLALEEAGIKVPDDPEEPARGDLACPSVSEVGQAFGMFVDAVRHEQQVLVHLGEQPLTDAVRGATTRKLSGALAWDHVGETDVSPLVAATNAFWAFVVREPLVTDDYDVLASVG